MGCSGLTVDANDRFGVATTQMHPTIGEVYLHSVDIGHTLHSAGRVDITATRLIDVAMTGPTGIAVASPADVTTRGSVDVNGIVCASRVVSLLNAFEDSIHVGIGRKVHAFLGHEVGGIGGA